MGCRLGLADQAGATMVTVSLALMAFTLLVGLALDFGRLYVYREQLRTAVDAASLAGALEAKARVLLKVKRIRWIPESYPCGDDLTDTCLRWYTRSDPIELDGYEQPLLVEGGWWRAADCDNPRLECDRSPPELLSISFELPHSAQAVAQRTFLANAHWRDSGDGTYHGPLAVGLTQGIGQVRVSARLYTPTHFLKLLGPQFRELETVHSGEARPTVPEM